MNMKEYINEFIDWLSIYYIDRDDDQGFFDIGRCSNTILNCWVSIKIQTNCYKKTDTSVQTWCDICDAVLDFDEEKPYVRKYKNYIQKLIDEHKLHPDVDYVDSTLVKTDGGDNYLKIASLLDILEYNFQHPETMVEKFRVELVVKYREIYETVVR
jgi:hypothetical protein